MKRLIQIHNHPFRFLLYIEWVLLVIAALSEASPYPFHQLSRLPLLTLSSIAAFAVMGLRLPTGKPAYKILYTGLEIVLIVLTGIARGIRLFPFLYLILVIRSC